MASYLAMLNRMERDVKRTAMVNHKHPDRPTVLLWSKGDWPQSRHRRVVPAGPMGRCIAQRDDFVLAEYFVHEVLSWIQEARLTVSAIASTQVYKP